MDPLGASLDLTLHPDHGLEDLQPVYLLVSVHVKVLVILNHQLRLSQGIEVDVLYQAHVFLHVPVFFIFICTNWRLNLCQGI